MPDTTRNWILARPLWRLTPIPQQKAGESDCHYSANQVLQRTSTRLCARQAFDAHFTWAIFADADEFLATASGRPVTAADVVALAPSDALAVSLGIVEVDLRVCSTDAMWPHAFVSQTPYCDCGRALWDYPLYLFKNKRKCLGSKGKRKSLVKLAFLASSRLERRFLVTPPLHEWRDAFDADRVHDVSTDAVRLHEVRGYATRPPICETTLSPSAARRLRHLLYSPW